VKAIFFLRSSVIDIEATIAS